MHVQLTFQVKFKIPVAYYKGRREGDTVKKKTQTLKLVLNAQLTFQVKFKILVAYNKGIKEVLLLCFICFLFGYLFIYLFI